MAKSRGRDAHETLLYLLVADDVPWTLGQLRERGVLASLLPEVEALASLSPPKDAHHKDLWAHTVEVVQRCQPRPLLRLAALFHDIGKVSTRQVSPGGEVTFHGHEEAGARLVEEKIGPRLAMTSEEMAALALLVRHHHRVGAYDQGWSDSAVRRLGRELGPHFVDLMDLGRADVTSRVPGRREASLLRVDELAERLRRLQEASARPAPLPPGLGRLVMERFGLSPGPQVGRLLGALKARVESGHLRTGEDPETYLRYLETHEALRHQAPRSED